jgi:hypothetical protein
LCRDVDCLKLSGIFIKSTYKCTFVNRLHSGRESYCFKRLALTEGTRVYLLQRLRENDIGKCITVTKGIPTYRSQRLRENDAL